jgi:hypothetical protein
MVEPVPSKVPPHELVYHFQLAPVPSLPPLILKSDVSARHIVLLEAVMLVAI